MKNKRLISTILLLVLLIANVGIIAFADESIDRSVHIATGADLRQFCKDCILDAYSENLTVYLDNDIDLGGSELNPIPVFSGIFEGQGHKISNFVLATDGSHQGLFRYIQDNAQVNNLAVEGVVKPEGSSTQVGGIAGVNNGTISFCVFNGDVQGKNYVGGIAGVNNGTIFSCISNGTVQGKRFTGGIAGYCEKEADITSCVNNALINTVITEGGIAVDKLNISNALETLNLVSVQDENIVSDVGGIVGYSQGEIDSCSNSGAVGYPHYAYNVGGIAGRQSGYIHECSNEGKVLGRYDVGGIVGQMEPYLILKDKQTLSDAISGLAATVYGALQKISGNADVIAEPANNISTDTQIMTEYLTNQGDPEYKGYTQEDFDAAFNDMGVQLSYLNGSIKDTVKTAANDFQSVNSAAYGVMNLAAYALSGNVSTKLYEDISDDSKVNDFDGRVSSCTNKADIDGDQNVGGIVGNIAVELEFDMEGSLLEAFSKTVDNGISAITYQTKAVCYKNINDGSVNSKKDYAGGIAGYQDVGTVSACENYADITAGESFCGGIAGRSNAVIRNSYAMCNLLGDEYVGGIAGYGENVIGCGTLVRMDGVTAAYGAISGYAYDFNEDNYGGNRFVSNDLGAIDGISYEGLASSESYSDFSSDENVPTRMKDLKITYIADEKTVKIIPFTYGGSIANSAVPDVPEKAGYSGAWPEFDYSTIYFSDVLEAEYYPNLGAVASDSVDEESGLPKAVIDGEFDTSTKLSVEPYCGDSMPKVSENESVIESSIITMDGSVAEDKEYSVRYLIPKSIDLEDDSVFVYRLNEDGTWTKLDTEIMSSYVSFLNEGNNVTVCIVQVLNKQAKILLGALIVIVLAAAVLFVVHRIKNRKMNRNSEAEGSDSKASDVSAANISMTQDNSNITCNSDADIKADEHPGEIAETDTTPKKKRGRPKKEKPEE